MVTGSMFTKFAVQLFIKSRVRVRGDRGWVGVVQYGHFVQPKGQVRLDNQTELPVRGTNEIEG